MKKVAAVVAGYLLWTLLWLAGNAGLRAIGVLPGDTTQPINAPPPLLALLLLSLVCSLAAGCVAGVLLRSSSTPTVVVLALLLLVTGGWVQSTLWHLLPLWYHVAFLGLLVPVTLLGGSVSKRCRS